MTTKTGIAILGALLLASCSDSSDNRNLTPADPGAPEYGLTDTPYTALQQVWEPILPSESLQAEFDNGTFTAYEHERYAQEGLGVRLAPGSPWIEHLELAPDFPGEGNDRRSIAYFLSIADPQLIDEESPIRLDGFWWLYRPQGQLTLQLLEAHVRTARRMSDLSQRQLDFALLPGDLTDSAQLNELEWLVTILNGGIVDPDSGVDDDPIPGPGNDYNDPFYSIGMDWPWYPALGNHDALLVGGFGAITEEVRSAARGDRLYNNNNGGYVAGDTPNHQVIFDDSVVTPADDKRLPLYKNEILQILHDADGDPAGHGLTQADVESSKGYYSAYPIPGRPLKLIVLDTSSSDPSTTGRGSMDNLQFSWLHEELVTAASNQELAIIVSHHRLEDFIRHSEVSGDVIKTLLASSPSVVLHITGHGHTNTKRLQTTEARNGYWELMSASPMDFPSQSRIIELVDERNGYLSVYVTNFGHNSDESTLAHKGRELAGGKLAFGYPGFIDDVSEYWSDDLTSQNLLLRLKLPEGVSNNIGAIHDWPDVVESLETLAEF